MSDEEIDNLCAYLDDLLINGKFEEADQWYADLLSDEDQLALFVEEDPSLGLTVLMVTYGEPYLPHRQEFYLYFQDHLLKRMSEADVLAHLGGLWKRGETPRIVNQKEIEDAE